MERQGCAVRDGLRNGGGRGFEGYVGVGEEVGRSLSMWRWSIEEARILRLLGVLYSAASGLC